MIILLYAIILMHGAFKNLERKLKRANQINYKCRKQPRLSQLIQIPFPRDNALGESRISANVVGNARTVLAALSYKVVIPTMLVILM